MTCACLGTSENFHTVNQCITMNPFVKLAVKVVFIPLFVFFVFVLGSAALIILGAVCLTPSINAPYCGDANRIVFGGGILIAGCLVFIVLMLFLASFVIQMCKET